MIGAGNIGGTLARRFTELGHAVSIANSRGPDTLGDVAAATGATPVAVHEAVRGQDLVVVTIPLKAVPELPEDLFSGAADDLVVVDTGNYYPERDGRITEIEDGMTGSRWTSGHIAHAMVKAFNNIASGQLGGAGLPADAAGRIALPVAGDDAGAKAVVTGLIDDLGFDAVDAGGLDDSWRQEPGTPVYGTDLDADGVRRALAEAPPR